MKVGVGALHRGIGKTKKNAKKEVYSRDDCGFVDRRAINEKKMGRKPPLKINRGWNIIYVTKSQLVMVVARP